MALTKGKIRLKSPLLLTLCVTFPGYLAVEFPKHVNDQRRQLRKSIFGYGPLRSIIPWGPK
ncbi:MAG: hypothetical protein ACYSUD_22040, partial [Planctomycetota bacterium]